MVAGRRRSWEAGNTTSGTALLCRKRRPHLQHSKELLLGDLQAIVVGGVHHENQSIRVGVVAPPVGANARLPAEVPHLEFDVLVLQGLYVEPDGRDRLFDLTCLQPVCRSEGGVCGRRGSNVSGCVVRAMRRMRTHRGSLSCRRYPVRGSGCGPPCCEMSGGGAMAVGGSRAGETAEHGGQLVGGTQLALGSLRQPLQSELRRASVCTYLPKSEENTREKSMPMVVW